MHSDSTQIATFFSPQLISYQLINQFPRVCNTLIDTILKYKKAKTKAKTNQGTGWYKDWKDTQKCQQSMSLDNVSVDR